MKPAMFFKDHMVLQRGMCVPVWGEATPGAYISLSFQGHHIRTIADDQGNWTIKLPPLRVGTSYTMVLESGSEILKLQDVAVGDVWLAGGQSNMEFHMRYDADLKEELPVCTNPLIRFFDVPEVAYIGQEQDRDYARFGYWRTCDPENLEYFSAVGYYFAKAVAAKTDVPIGILGCNWGGSRAVCWMDEETAEVCAKPWLEDYKKGLEAIDDPDAWEKDYKTDPMTDRTNPFAIPFMDRMMYGMTPEELQEMITAEFGEGGSYSPTIGPIHEWRPCGLFETMLLPTIPYGVYGVIWYQGESDADHPDIYAGVLSQMITLWRRLWDAPLPFIMTQLAPLDAAYDPSAAAYPALRQAQAAVAAQLPNVWCATAGDVGSRHDIHPKKKQPVGTRMAALALNHVYGFDVPADSPEGISCTYTDGALSVALKYAEGLCRSDDRPLPLEVVLADRTLTEEDGLLVTLGDDAIRIASEKDDLASASRVNLGFTPYYEMNLYNQDGFPAKPWSLKVK